MCRNVSVQPHLAQQDVISPNPVNVSVPTFLALFAVLANAESVGQMITNPEAWILMVGGVFSRPGFVPGLMPDGMIHVKYSRTISPPTYFNKYFYYIYINIVYTS